MDDCVLEFYKAVQQFGQSNTREAFQAVQRVSDSERQNLSEASLGRLDRLEGNLLSWMGRFREADAKYDQAWRRFESNGLTDDLLQVGTGWSDALAHLSRFAEAHALVARCSTMLTPQSRRAESRFDISSAGIFLLQGDRKAAARHYGAARRKAKKVDDTLAYAMATFNLGSTWFFEGRLRRCNKYLTEARGLFEQLNVARGMVYVDFARGLTMLASDDWVNGKPLLESVRSRIEAIGDQRLLARVQRSEAEFLFAIGAVQLAEELASDSRRNYEELAMDGERARSAFLQARILGSMGRFIDARVRIVEAQEVWDATGMRVLHDRASVELAGVLCLNSRYDEALEILRSVARYLCRKDPYDSAVRCRHWMARCYLGQRRPGVAAKLAQRAYAEATRYPIRVERPRLAMTTAKALSAMGQHHEAIRWARRAVSDMEKIYLALGARVMRSHASASLGEIAEDVVEVVRNGGDARFVRTELDLLMRCRTPELVEDLLLGSPNLAAGLRSSIAVTRDQLIENPALDRDDGRADRMHAQMKELETRVSDRIGRSPDVIRRTLAQRTLSRWTPSLKGRTAVIFDQCQESWSAYVLEDGRSVRRVPLPDLQRTLSRDWLSLRMTLEHIASLPTEMRSKFLERTTEESESCLQSLRRALWDPLEIADGPVTLFPSEPLASLPLESLAETDSPSLVLSRWPHPAVGQSRSVRAQRALLLCDGSGATELEVDEIAKVLTTNGLSVETIQSRESFQQKRKPLGLLHVAAHGSFHRDQWLLNGIKLSDGWIGFEHLNRTELKGSLLYFSSCDSGLETAGPGSDLSGWATAGVGVGAHGLILSLWKIDDGTAREYAREFYARWSRGVPYAAAASEARRALRARRAHPFSWASFSVVAA